MHATLAALVLLAPLRLDVEVLLTLRDGSALRGVLTQKTLDLENDEFEAKVALERVGRVEFGDVDRIVTASGVVLEGDVGAKSLRLAVGGGNETVRVAELLTLEVLVDGRPVLSEDFTGDWMTSFGPMSLTQTGAKVSGTYGFDDEFRIEGEVDGAALAFVAREPNGTSEGTFELWDDGETFTGQFRFNGGDERFWGAYRAGGGLPEPRPGEVTTGQSASGLNLHLRVPEAWKPGEAWPAVALLHGSNMSARAYVDTFAASWPALAEEFVLLGLDGERLSSASREGARAFNYTYVNFSGPGVGASWVQRQSPALVAEALDEVKAALGLRHWIVGGHSQGGFLTWAVALFFPDRIVGAFPMSCNLLVQCEPDYGYFTDRPELLARQRQLALAPIHGARDGVVDPSGGAYSYRAMQDGGFPHLRYFLAEDVGHEFAWLPVDDAVRWIQTLADGDAARLATLARRELDAGRTRAATSAVLRGRERGATGEEARALDEIEAAVDALAGAERGDLLRRLSTGGEWVDDFWEFRRRFHFTPGARAVIEAYEELRAEQAEAANELFWKARNEGDDERRQAMFRELVEAYPASKWVPLVKGWLD